MNEAKPFVVESRVVMESWLQVKANRGSAGIDGIDLKSYESNLQKNLYKLWNRMSSGSYFPKAVKLVEIPKPNGGKRPLGIPTVEDRVAQMVVVMYIAPRLEAIFHEDSYGYRPWETVKHGSVRREGESPSTYSTLKNIFLMKRILVTGGAGFIGSHLCERLVNEGNDVICLDNFYSGSKENVWHLIGKPNFELVRHDVVNPYWAEVDEIYNLACPASPIYYQNDPIQTTKTSVFGAYHMLGLARRTKAKILQSSTSEVYGDPNVHPQPETYWGNVNPIGLRSCYDEGKRCAETLFFDYHRLHGVRTKVIRIFNTYGPRMAVSDGRVVSNFVVQALRGEDITIYGDGQQTRSFQYVSDLIEGMLRVMATGDDFTGPVNLGNPGEFTMLELAEKVIKKIGGKSKIVFRPLPSDDPKMRRPDIAKAKSELGWEPKVTLDEGLDHIIQYFREYLKL